MKKFVVLYHASPSAMEEMAKRMATNTPADMAKEMEPWMAWAARCGSGLVDIGSPLTAGLRLSVAGSAPTSGDVIGYSILQAEDMESAKALMDGHPHLGWADGCEIAIHESAPNGM